MGLPRSTALPSGALDSPPLAVLVDRSKQMSPIILVIVMCGRPLLCKGKVTDGAVESGAVMCPACWCGADGRWP